MSVRVLLLVGVLVVSGCGGGAVTPPPPEPGTGTACRSSTAGLVRIHGAPAVRGQLLVRFRPGVDRGRVLADLRLTELRALDGSDLSLVSLPASESVERAITRLRGRPEIVQAEPDYVASVRATPNDRLFPQQWGLDQINASQAWDVTTGSSGVTVAVLDTGIRRNHPDLGSNVLQGRDICQGDSDPTDPGDPDDPSLPSHGTLVTGVIAALTNNNEGIAGVSWGAGGARILPVRVCNGDGACTYSDLVAGINWAVDNGARVLNISVAGDRSSDALRDAVRNAVNRGAVVVAAAGNDGGDTIDFPARFPEAIAVGASAPGGARAGYSNCGPELSLIAPGGDGSNGVLSTAWSPRDGFGYAEFRGTSFAAPHVAGVAALVLSRASRTPSQVRSILESTATDIGAAGRDNCTGFGIVNANAAVRAP